MLPFTAPLLALTDRVGNFGFELVGRGGTGKSTVQQFMASALGGPVPGPAGHYWITLDATRAGMEIALREHSDMAMILEEANLFSPGESERVRGNRMRDLAFQLASGHEKLKHGSGSPRSYRTVYLISSNQSLRELAMGGSASATSAAADRLITLPVPDVGGVFDGFSEQFKGQGEFAKALLKTAGEQHGTAIRRFLAKLVQHRADGEDELRERIEHHVRRFRKAAGVGDDDGSLGRVADAFGLVMAAGRLAQHYRVLPRKLDCDAVALACYRLHRPDTGRKASILDRFVDISCDPRTVTIDRSNLRHFSDPQLEKHGVFICRNRRGETELLFWPAAFRRLFPDYARILRLPEVLRILRRDKERATVKRAIRLGRPDDRVYCFVLPS